MFKSTSAQGEHGGEVELGTSPSWRYVFLSIANDDDDDDVLCSRASLIILSASRARLSLLLCGLFSRKTSSGETRRRAIDRGVGRRECVGNNSLHRFAAFYRVDAASMRAPRSSRPAAGSFARFAPAKDDEPGSSHRPRRRRPERVYRTTNE